MSYLFILNETFTNGLDYNVINVLSLLAILSSIFVIVSKNPIVSVLFLIGLFLNIACYLMMLGMNFLGLSYLLVYVGAVSILFLFILMLINVRISELTSETSNSLPLAVFIGVLFNITLYKLLPYNITFPNSLFIQNKLHIIDTMEGGILPLASPILTSRKYFYNNDLSYVTSQMWDGALAESSHITSIGNTIYTNYPLWLILTSLILLLAMVGAIVITMRSNHN